MPTCTAMEIAQLALDVKPEVISVIEENVLSNMDEHDTSGRLSVTYDALVLRFGVVKTLTGNAKGMPFKVVGLRVNARVVSIQRAPAS